MQMTTNRRRVKFLDPSIKVTDIDRFCIVPISAEDRQDIPYLTETLECRLSAAIRKATEICNEHMMLERVEIIIDDDDEVVVEVW